MRKRPLPEHSNSALLSENLPPGEISPPGFVWTPQYEHKESARPLSHQLQCPLRPDQWPENEIPRRIVMLKLELVTRLIFFY